MAATERLLVEVPADLVATLREAVRRGEFGSESEAVSAILRVWHGEDGLGDEIDDVRRRVAEGLAEADAGGLADADEVHAELRDRIRTVAHRGG